MKQKELQFEEEMLIIVGLVTSERILRELEPLYKSEWLDGAWSKRVAGWAWDYWKAYRQPPRQYIQDIFTQSVADGSIPDSEADLVGTFLQRLNDQYESGQGQLNEEYILDMAEKRFGRRSIVELANDMKDAVARGEIGEAETLIGNWKCPVRVTSDGVNPLTDVDFVRSAFEDAPTPLFKYGGPFGQMINPLMVRQGFVAVMAPAKRGKSWTLMDFGIQGLKSSQNVAYFSTGDMTKEQLTVRMHIRLAGKSNREQYCQEERIPCLDCKLNQAGRCNHALRRGKPGLPPIPEGQDPMTLAPAGYEACSHCSRERHSQFRGALWWRIREPVEPLTWREGLRIAGVFEKHCRGRSIRLESFPTGTLKISAIRAKLDLWERRDGWIPDIILTDYADIMCADDAKLEFRHQQNSIWIGHRALSMERKALVITATQSDADSYNVHTLGLKNFTEDRRKYDHVTGMITLNQLPAEKRIGIMRTGVLLAREEVFDAGATVNVLTAPVLGRTVLGSFW